MLVKNKSFLSLNPLVLDICYYYLSINDYSFPLQEVLHYLFCSNSIKRFCYLSCYIDKKFLQNLCACNSAACIPESLNYFHSLTMLLACRNIIGIYDNIGVYEYLTVSHEVLLLKLYSCLLSQ